tara:strand:+ start:1768 stop:2415 length:648 start_codon:yes stop_codon:yes gene_type:complete
MNRSSDKQRIHKSAQALATKLEKTKQKLKTLTKEHNRFKRRFQSLLSQSPAIIYTSKVSDDFGITFISDNVLEKLGYSPKQFLTDPSFWMNHIHPDDRERVLKDFAKVFKHSRHVHEYRFRRKDRIYRWIHDEFSLIKDKSGHPVEIIGSWMDITQQKKIEQTSLSHQANVESLRGQNFDMVKSAVDLAEARKVAEDTNKRLRTALSRVKKKNKR